METQNNNNNNDNNNNKSNDNGGIYKESNIEYKDESDSGSILYSIFVI